MSRDKTQEMRYETDRPAEACPGPDSNRDALRHCPLKTACLPVSPPGRREKRRRAVHDGQAKSECRMQNSSFSILHSSFCIHQLGECTPFPSYGRLEPMPGPDGLMASRLLSICAMIWRIDPGNDVGLP